MVMGPEPDPTTCQCTASKDKTRQTPVKKAPEFGDLGHDGLIAQSRNPLATYRFESWRLEQTRFKLGGSTGPGIGLEGLEIILKRLKRQNILLRDPPRGNGRLKRFDADFNRIRQEIIKLPLKGVHLQTHRDEAALSVGISSKTIFHFLHQAMHSVGEKNERSQNQDEQKKHEETRAPPFGWHLMTPSRQLALKRA
mgnify:CR=1 FL=1